MFDNILYSPDHFYAVTFHPLQRFLRIQTASHDR